MKNKIGIIDYGFGNLGSVKNALDFLGIDSEIFDDVNNISNYSKLILPGVGAFEDAINTLREKKFDIAIKEAVENGTPILGICLGMQLLFDKSYENGEHIGLSLLKGDIVRFNESLNVKVPHIGWNSLKYDVNSKLYKNIQKEPYVYFVHSYHLKTDENIVSATTFYGTEIQVSVEKDNIFGVQFHPEKSGDIGLKMLENFCCYC